MWKKYSNFEAQFSYKCKIRQSEKVNFIVLRGVININNVVIVISNFNCDRIYYSLAAYLIWNIIGASNY